METSNTFRYGFRIVGPCSNDRKLVDAVQAFDAYASCDPRARVESEAYLSAFQFGDEFREHMNANVTTKGYTGPCWARFLWFDIDREDRQVALNDTRHLIQHIRDHMSLEPEHILAFFSGSKGFHVGIPTALWNPEPSPDFHKVARAFCEGVAERAEMSIDTGVYDRVRAFRAPNSRHPKTSLQKRQIDAAALLTLSLDAVLEIAKTPEPFDVPEPSPKDTDWNISADWETATKRVREKIQAVHDYRQCTEGAPHLNRATLQFIREGASVGDRHRLLFSAAANLAEFGCPAELAHALLTEAGLDSGLPPKEIRRQIECGLGGIAV